MLENKGGNISETRKDRGKVTMDGLCTVSKKTVQTYFLSELCQISTDCGNFRHKDSKENKLFCGVLVT